MNILNLYYYFYYIYKKKHQFYFSLNIFEIFSKISFVGLEGNPLYKLIRENPTFFQHKKKKLFSDEFIFCADDEGRIYETEMCQELYEEYKLWNLEAKSIWVNKKKTNFKSYTDFMVNKLESYIINEPDDVKHIKRAILTRLLKQETCESGCASMDLCSINEYGSYLKPFGPDVEFPGGYSKLIEFISRKIPESYLKLSHPVKYIQQINKENVENDDDDYRLMVECYNGTCFRAKHVVVTCSINYLKKNLTNLFDPILLSEKKIEAINAIKMDTVDKIFMLYEDMSFFPESINALHPIFPKEDQLQDIEKNWHHKVYTFDKFYDNLLMVWITGLEANYIEKLPDEEIVETLTKLLRNLLANPDIPRPARLFKTSWNSNPFILGSYSYIDVNCSANKHINNLAEPIYIDKTPRILFAGEATHLRYYSTVHGAYLSGQREAKRIFDFYSSSEL